jgi:hypothetical protein
MEKLRDDFIGMIPCPNFHHKCNFPDGALASVDFVTLNHVRAGQFGYAIAHSTIRMRKGVPVKADLAWIKEKAKELETVAKYWYKGQWYTA